MNVYDEYVKNAGGEDGAEDESKAEGGAEAEPEASKA